MERNYTLTFDPEGFETPVFIVDEDRLAKNLAVLDSVQKRTGARILLALKGFAMFSLFPEISKTLHGVCASSPHEARLGREEFGREVHSFAAAFSESDLAELLSVSDHIVFNSFSQWKRFRHLTSGSDVSFGMRVNHGHSEAEVEIYDPCAPFSRLGVPFDTFEKESIEGLSGLHFHSLCEQNSDALERTLSAFDLKFGKYLKDMKWVNFGGGHHITRPDYDIDLLCSLIDDFRERYDVEVYLEPGEAVALDTGFLVTTVLDVIHNGMDIAILDTSAAAHMPDVLEMPYRPEIIGAGPPCEFSYTYRLGGLSCLAGDVIGDYSFPESLVPGDRLVFCDMAHYTMVKTNTFNGIKLPSIAVKRHGRKDIEIIKRFGYEDFRGRLS